MTEDCWEDPVSAVTPLLAPTWTVGEALTEMAAAYATSDEDARRHIEMTLQTAHLHITVYADAMAEDLPLGVTRHGDNVVSLFGGEGQ